MVDSDHPFSLDDVREAFPELDVAEEIDRGTSKVCYRARTKTGEGRALLIALVSSPDGGEADAVEVVDIGAERLRREVLAMQLVDSPRVVKVLEGPDVRLVGPAPHIWFLEPCYEVTLAARMNEDWERDGVASLLVGLVDGVAALWGQQGLVHRDIKPANVAFDDAGEALLLDLSAAFQQDWTTLTYGQGPHTLLYAAPEQLQVRQLAEIDFRTDLFSVGIVAFQVWTKQHPFLPVAGGTPVVGPPAYPGLLTAGTVIGLAPDSPMRDDPLMQFILHLIRPAQNQRFRTVERAREVLQEVVE